MYSDDEEIGFGGRGSGRQLSRSPDPRRGGGGGGGGRGGDGHDDRRRSRSRGRGGDGAGGSKGKGKGKGKSRSTGQKLPKLNSIHQASVASIQSYGAFVKLGDGSEYKDGLLHVSRISASGRIESVTDVLSEGDPIWVKVCDLNEDLQKYSVDMRFVRQKDGEDLDPNNTQADSRGAKGGGKGPEPIRIGAVQDTICSRCGARGHMARECWAGGGKNYDLVDEVAEPEVGVERPMDAVPGVNPKIVKAALEAYMKRKAVGDDSPKRSSKDKKEKKKEKKEKKKEKKKDKKQEKKLKKQGKKDAKRLKKEFKAIKKAKEREKAKVKEKDKGRQISKDTGNEKESDRRCRAKDEGKDSTRHDKAALLADVSSASSSSSSSSS